MASSSSSRKDNLIARIEDSGVILLFPCVRCDRLNKTCIKSEISKRCNECVRSGRCRCCFPEMSSDFAWKKLVAAQRQLDEEEEAALAKILRLRKQRRLLQKRAGEFLQKDIKDVEELERLDEQEQKLRDEQDRLAKEREDAVKAAQLAATSESDATLTQLMNDPSLWPIFDLPGDGIAQPSGGSPSNSR
jgi:hypothetical protein